MYSIYSQGQPRDLGMSPFLSRRCPISHDVGIGPTPCSENSCYRRSFFWLNKPVQDDSYTMHDRMNSAPSKVRIYIFNALATSDEDILFDAWSVGAHVRRNRQAWEVGFSARYLPVRLDEIIPPHPPPPILPPSTFDVPVSLLPPSFAHQLIRSQSDDTLTRITHIHSPLTRKPIGSRAIYIREFISTDSAPAPVVFAVSSYEPPATLDMIRAHFSPDARPFIIQAALRSAFLNPHIRTVRARFGDELTRLFPLLSYPPLASHLLPPLLLCPLIPLCPCIPLFTFVFLWFLFQFAPYLPFGPPKIPWRIDCNVHFLPAKWKLCPPLRLIVRKGEVSIRMGRSGRIL